MPDSQYHKNTEVSVAAAHLEILFILTDVCIIVKRFLELNGSCFTLVIPVIKVSNFWQIIAYIFLTISRMQVMLMIWETCR